MAKENIDLSVVLHNDSDYKDWLVELKERFYSPRCRRFQNSILYSMVSSSTYHRQMQGRCEQRELIHSRNERQETRLVPQGLCSGTLDTLPHTG